MPRAPFSAVKRTLLTLAGWLTAATCASMAASPALAQDRWPNRPIKLVVPFPAGSFTDNIARVLSDRLNRSLGQPVVVENKVGANGVIGVSEVAKAPADGYTLLVTNSSSITVNPQIYKSITYSASDFVPVTILIEAGHFLVANQEWAQANAINSVNDIIQFAQKNPGKLNYGSAGPGNIAHLSYALLSNRTQVRTTHVPYRSSAQAQLALMSGEIQTSFDTWSAVPHIRSGKLKALAVTSAKRAALAPDIPTMEEAGVNDFVITFWIGLLAPAGTPAPIVQRLAAVAQGLNDDAKAKATLSAQGEVVLSDPATFAARIAKEVPQWGAVITREQIKVD